MKRAVLPVLIAGMLSSLASAEIVYTAGGTLATPFYSGTGVDNDNFYMAANTANGTTLALRARTRWTNDEVFSGSTYTCQTGYSPTSSSDPTPSPYATWNFDLACYGPDVIPTTMWMSVDFDPSANAGGATLATIPFQYITGIPAAGPYYGSENMGFAY